MKLKDIREEIDRIDARILSLLTERMERALLTCRFKEKAEDPAREATVLERARQASRGILAADFSVASRSARTTGSSRSDPTKSMKIA